jgi:Predicted phosphoesterases, related to the Icc protein
MLAWLYSTDLHGNEEKYNNILEFAVDHQVPLIHLGADLLSKGSDLLGIQKTFVNGFLKNFFKKCRKKGIDVICSWGNDDIYPLKIYFKKYGSLLDEVPYCREGYEFKAYPWVTDYPFRLKTATKLDSDGWSCPDPYLGSPCDFDEQGYFEIPDIKEYFRKKGTIEDDLKSLKATNKTIMSMHMPPAGVELDVCYGGRRVGSKAIYSWIEKNQPLAVLCGHVHESPKVSGFWKANIGNTLVIQPGQDTYKTTMVCCEVSEKDIKATLIEK